MAGQRQPLGTIPEGLGASSGLLLALGPWGKAGPVEGVEGGAAWLGPAVTVGQDLPCPIHCRFPGGQSGVWWRPIPIWVPSANPGHSSHQVLGKVHQGRSTG